MKPCISARIESINRLPWPLPVTASTPAVSPLRRNSMTCASSASLASTSGAMRVQVLAGSADRGKPTQFFKLAADAIPHRQIRLQEGLVAGQRKAALTGLGIRHVRTADRSRG